MGGQLTRSAEHVAVDAEHERHRRRGHRYVERRAVSLAGADATNAAYDLFTSSTAGGSNEYEIMIWLANYGAGPISYNYDSQGNPVPVATSVALAGNTWYAPLERM